MRDRSPIWIGLCDLTLAVLSVVIVAVNPVSAKKDGIEEKAEYLASVEWPVSIDADVDIWLAPPKSKPVFYAARDVGCARLDSDNRGFMDERITLADGSVTTVRSDKETISLRCIEPGRYDLAANLYAYRKNAASVSSGEHGIALPVHVEIVGVNPSVHLVFQKDVTLDHVGETVNVISFDLDRVGNITLASPPLEPVTAHAYRSSGYPGGTGAPTP